MNGYFFTVNVTHSNGTHEPVKFYVDTTTTWHQIRNYLCNNGGDLYYLYYGNKIIRDTDHVMPLIETIDDLEAQVHATTKRSEYIKRMKYF